MKVGDRVKLAPHDSWNQPYRGWAERGRLGTVTGVFTPHGSPREKYQVRFDRSRPTTRGEVFERRDLIIVDVAETATAIDQR